MALPSSGQIFMSQIAQELGIDATGLTLNDSRVRDLAGKPSGPVWFSDFWGKSAMSQLTIGRYDNSGRSYLGFQGASPIGANYGVLRGTKTPQGDCVALYIQRWSQYDNKIIFQTNNLYVAAVPITFQLAGMTFNYTVKSNDMNGFAIPNTMSDLFISNQGKVCLVKFG